ncbi:MAG: hypothetical protein NT030_01920, partial [Candidatus Saganbacteria bacterium]|nr:hypothetical protein [Candidatus Saganbacteria bacterium]
FCLLGPAEEKDLLLNAEQISFSKDNNIVNATGNVSAEYTDLNVAAPHLIYDSKKREIYADKGFILLRDKQRIEGNILYYGIDTKSGSAEGVNMRFEGVFLKGAKIRLEPKVVDFKDASFTSCDERSPHYHVSASDISIYTDTGWIVAYWGLFWFQGIPIIPVPTYRYSIGPRENDAPVPEIGSNDEDGGYIHERIPWYSNRYLYGRVTLSYASKQGIGGGVDGNLIVNDENNFNGRVYTLGKDGMWGGLTYTHAFGPETGEEEELLPGLVPAIKTRKYVFSTNFSLRERINYDRVYLVPEVTLRSNDDEFFFPNLTYSFELGAAAVSEESTGVKTAKDKFKFDLAYKINLGVFGKLLAGLELYDRWYGVPPAKWLQLLEKFDIEKEWNPVVKTGIGYSHFMMNDGNSPFAFEMYRFSPLDEARANVFFTLGRTGFGVNTYYNYPSWDPKDIDYTLSIGFHCYDIITTYRALRKEFSFGMRLFSK